MLFRDTVGQNPIDIPPDDLKILPGLRPTVGRTTADARAKFNELQALLHPLVALSTLSSTFGDLPGYP